MVITLSTAAVVGLGYLASVGAIQHAAALTSGLAQGTRHLVRRDMRSAALSLIGGVVEPVALTAKVAGYALEDVVEATKDITAVIANRMYSNRLGSGVNGVPVGVEN
jgi:hypothetical protein